MINQCVLEKQVTWPTVAKGLLSQEMFSQQSAYIKKLKEVNQSLQKKHSKTLESNMALQTSCNELSTEVNFLKDQVRELWKKKPWILHRPPKREMRGDDFCKWNVRERDSCLRAVLCYKNAIYKGLYGNITGLL